MKEIEPVFIRDTRALKEMVARILKQKKQIAFDFECEFNLHRYGMHLCLIQLFDGTDCYLIDPLTIDDLRVIKRLFTSKVLKVMFAARGDLCLLQHLYNLHMKHIFDIQIAAQLLEFESLSLGGVLKAVLNVKTDKSKSKQRANWNRRPLPQNLIRYAMDDVLYLLELKEKLQQRMSDRELKARFAQENKKLEHARFNPVTDPHLKIKWAKQLNRRQRQYLKSFYEVRDNISRELDISPHNLLRNDTLVEIARRVPRSRREWMGLKGLNKRALPFIDRFIRAKEKLEATRQEEPDPGQKR